MSELLYPLLGGALIGLAAVLLMATEGQIMGVSGILSRLVPAGTQDRAWRWVFLLGVVLVPLLYPILTGKALQSTMTSNIPLLVVAGLLVGLGTATGNGCTSGHGVCGLSRLSPRSLVAVAVFMGTAFLTVFLLRHVIGA